MNRKGKGWGTGKREKTRRKGKRSQNYPRKTAQSALLQSAK
jgi:hypothetical protein